MRFRPEQRLRRPGDFRDAREKGRRLDCGGFTIWYHRRPDRSASAFVVVEAKDSAAPSPNSAPTLESGVGPDLGQAGAMPPQSAMPKAEIASTIPLEPNRLDQGRALRRNHEPAAYAGPRVGVVASRAAVGNAVQRNRAKRRLREVFRRNQDKIPAGLDLMIIARGVVNNWAYADIERKFLEACRKLPAAVSSAK